ncbi:MAG: penicillin acylase family protein [Chloroflexi bacterium]|nr:penicillin acylase family protein [Chloroflexota bacterium]OJV92872.1 MAG: hypothetical protein BGO39_30440 [Chloroflexi bacterium 54-19]
MITTGILVLLIFLAATSIFFWLVLRPLPQTSGSVTIPGLANQVEVRRDEWGVAHIKASNTSDLYLAQGYVTAQDRLWQMDFYRRIGAGRLSEVLGSGAIDQDRFLRTLGLRQAALTEVNSLSPDDATILDSYARGVNAFIDTHKDNLPLEFTLLGYKPEPWSSVDTISWGKVMAYNQAINLSYEILRANLVDKFGTDQAHFLMPLSTLENTPFVVPTGVSYNNFADAPVLQQLQTSLNSLFGGGEQSGIGSNNWVVAGAKSVTGKPFLANDVHLGINNPSIWYEIDLQSPDFHVAGVSFPGVPGVIAGHNDRIAWGVTDATGDVEDLYIEKVNPANPNQYEFQGKWEDMQLITEVIKVKDQPSQTITVRQTRHGPLLNDVHSSLKDKSPMALKFVALGNTPLIGAVLKYDRATNWAEFRQALQGFTIAPQNFVYADIEGNIGYQLTGQWPVRAKGDGLLPVPGWTGEYEWTGFIPFNNLPSAYNPAQNFLFTANNQQAPTTDKFYIGQEFNPGWRAQRLNELLSAKDKFSQQDMIAIQNDYFSNFGKTFSAKLGALSSSDPMLQGLIQRLKDWDGRLTADSVPAAIYKVTYQYMLENLFKARLGDLYQSYIQERNFHEILSYNLLKDPANEWWGPGGEDALLLKSLDQAAGYLNDQLGNNPDKWSWGKLHTKSFEQNPVGGAAPFPINAILNLKTVELGGDDTTIAAMAYSYGQPYKLDSGVSYRQVVDLANLDASVIVNSVGQSAQPFNQHYGDNIDDWLSGKYHPFVFSEAKLSQYKTDNLLLKPAA